MFGHFTTFCMKGLTYSAQEHFEKLISKKIQKKPQLYTVTSQKLGQIQS